MSDDPSLLAQIGLRVPELTGGAAGGIVNSFLFRASTALSILGNITVGALMANYVTESAVRIMGTSERLTGFAIGLAGMAAAQILYDRAVAAAGKLKAKTETPDGPSGPNA
jgi:hypothetical protein